VVQPHGKFGAFCFDITHLVHPGRNLVAVKVDNARFEDVPPLSGDFTVFGGLYRSVHLLTLPALSIDPLDDGSGGVYIRQSNVSKESADIDVTVKLRNAYSQAMDAQVECILYGASEMAITRQVVNQRVPGQGTADAVVHIHQTHPVLWNGLKNPYLYRLAVSVSGPKTVDTVHESFGLRYFSIDPEKGFFLNGEPYALHGVNAHQEWPDEGWAIRPEQLDQNYKLVKEIGANVIRLPHYQHSEYEYGICDRAGLVAWAELALVNRAPKNKAFFDNAKQQLRELIKQNYNHPSICCWSLYNELLPPKEGSATQVDLINQLNDLAHQLDDTRPTTGAVWGEENMPMNYPANWIMDVTGINRYYGWYYGSNNQWSRWLDRVHAAHSEHPIAISEYGFGASLKQHQLNPTTHPAPGGPWHPEEWQAIAHEQTYPVLKSKPWLWGTMIWAMFDFASDGRNEGKQPGINDKGLVAHDHKTRKDAFYYYKAQWSDDPFVHITSRRYDPHPALPTMLKVYSNCESVELFRNGHSLGRGESPQPGVFTWPDVDLKQGRATLRAVGRFKGKSFTDEFTWKVSSDAPADAPEWATSKPSSARRNTTTSATTHHE
jgi:beta-galactosidase